MEKIVNEIYSQCEEKLNSSQIERLIEELETLAESKAEQEESEYEFEEDPYNEVARENCKAFSDNIL